MNVPVPEVEVAPRLVVSVCCVTVVVVLMNGETVESPVVEVVDEPVVTDEVVVPLTLPLKPGTVWAKAGTADAAATAAPSRIFSLIFIRQLHKIGRSNQDKQSETPICDSVPTTHSNAPVGVLGCLC